MQDVIGQEIKVGDSVLHFTPNSYRQSIVYIVAKLTKQMVSIKTTLTDYNATSECTNKMEVIKYNLDAMRN